MTVCDSCRQKETRLYTLMLLVGVGTVSKVSVDLCNECGRKMRELMFQQSNQYNVQLEGPNGPLN